ncbi:HAMP domain-containing histidine kinase [Undibacterium seohonense]|uniref:histidine kinase n=1 Tax=Undibacterium seohonense TaxID=1344950 RepID=A0ABR6X5K4_9BURK|nr:HAMP domain-containing sensor histidine kinase [Undibacterium seohonense]MBC3808192.1 HAMP domain-containing histidine kinase [Undibacterium seohonense]
MLNLLYPFLIIIGTTIAVVLGYLWWRARTASNHKLALIRLNEANQFDAPAFLQQAWPILEAAGLLGMRWRCNWFGIVIEGADGIHQSKALHQEIHVGEMHLSIDFFQHRRGERQYFDTALIETFILLLRSDMWIKAGAVDATLAQMSKLTLFLQHDMKNVAQFIQLMADQLAAVPPGKELQVLNYLRTAAPLMRQRADRIVQTLTLGQMQNEVPKKITLDKLCNSLIELYQLRAKITGNAYIVIAETRLETALENILKNYSDLHLRLGGNKPLVSIQITTEADRENESIAISIFSEDTPAMPHIERLFEPFWSMNPNGLGIGLYQAKHLLESCGGTLNAQETENGRLAFHIQLPAAPQINMI